MTVNPKPRLRIPEPHVNREEPVFQPHRASSHQRRVGFGCVSLVDFSPPAYESSTDPGAPPGSWIHTASGPPGNAFCMLKSLCSLLTLPVDVEAYRDCRCFDKVYLITRPLHPPTPSNTWVCGTCCQGRTVGREQTAPGRGGAS